LCGSTDHAFGGQTVEDRSGVERNDSGDGRPPIGDDDVVAITRSVDPLTEVGSQFRHGNIHAPKCTSVRDAKRTDLGLNAMTILNSLHDRDHPKGVLIADRAYFPNSKAEKLQLQARALGWEWVNQPLRCPFRRSTGSRTPSEDGSS